MLLDQKTAIIYGASGAIGSAVARAYAREGANVHLAGRTERPSTRSPSASEPTATRPTSHALTSSTERRSSGTRALSPRPAARRRQRSGWMVSR
jgi:3-oxoacyl-[acyl-carrier protein] reductase